jgi:hypothetical protein
MRLVIVESPYAPTAEHDVETHLTYARMCIKDSLDRGEAPLASHLLYTQPSILDDTIPEERMQGIQAGLAWVPAADVMIVYTDFGISPGMERAVALATELKIEIEYRTIL